MRDRPLAPRIDARLFLLFSARSDKRDSTTLAYQVVYKGLERKLNIRVDEYDWINDCHCSEPGRTCLHPAPPNHGEPGVTTSSCALRSSTNFLPTAARIKFRFVAVSSS